jgi:hypothetical protein
VREEAIAGVAASEGGEEGGETAPRMLAAAPAASAIVVRWRRAAELLFMEREGRAVQCTSTKKDAMNAFVRIRRRGNQRRLIAFVAQSVHTQLAMSNR